VEWREIAASADLRVVLQTTRSKRIADGWVCDDIGWVCSFFFAELAGDRVLVGIERYDPAGPGAPGHSDGAHIARE
jgi:hypothetical protein